MRSLVDPGVLELPAAGVTRSEHQPRRISRHIEAAAENSEPLTAEVIRFVEERHIGERHHQRSDRCAGNDPGGVRDVDGAGDRLDARATKPQPRLVQQHPAEA